MDGVQNPVHLWEVVVLALWSRCDPVAASHHCHRCVQVVKGQLGDVGGDGVEEGATLSGITCQHKLSSLFHGLHNLLVVQGIDEADVDDLSVHAVLLLQNLGSVHGPIEGGSDGGDGNVLSTLPDGGLSLRYLVVAFGNATCLKFLSLVVEQLALKEDDRVGSPQCQVQHTLGVVGCGREHHLQSGNVGHQGGPVLAVLGTVLVSDRYADGQRHLQQAGRHGLPLGCLVEDFVSSTAHEVTVHQLYNGTATAHGITYTGTDDGSLGDGAVEQAVVGQGFCQSTVYGKGSAPVTVLLSPGSHGGIRGEAVVHGLEETVPVLEHLVLGHGLSIRIEGGANLVLQCLHPRIGISHLQHFWLAVLHLLHLLIGEHDRLDEGGGGTGAFGIVGGQLHHLQQLGVDGCLLGLHLGLGDEIVLDEVLGVLFDGVGLLPGLDLFL